ncbi:unnamed protein product [Laminaria digitata]
MTPKNPGSLSYEVHFFRIVFVITGKKDAAGGFVPVGKDEAAIIKTQKRRIAIPPGAILVFHENIIHEVLARKVKDRTVRLFTAWRLTLGDSVMDPELKKQLDSQAIITIKSCKGMRK